MGIPGLLKMLKPYTQPVHVKKYSGKRVGIDAYCWLHKGAYACSFGVCERDQKTSFMQPCVKYCMHRINMLRFNHIIPVVVFDGGRLPSKASTENERQRRRDLNLEQARLKLSQGDVNGAEELYQRAVEITPLMAHEFIKVLKAEGVEFVVAPYEADAQLAYLSSLGPEKGGITAVISEDSDLLAYGCNVVIYKMDRYGNGEEVTLDDVMKRKGTKEGAPNSLWFGCFTPKLFTGMCVLAGCDFLPSVPGIGIKRAHGLVCKYRDLARVLSSMRFDRKLAVPEGYELGFKQANAIFHHARVYDASSRKLSFLKPLPAHFVKGFNGELDFLGPDLPPSRALAIAQGRLDPISMCAFDEFSCVVHPSCPDVPKTPDVGTPLWDEAMQGDVWLGTDEELFATLAASELEVPCSPSNASASCSTANLQLDNGFLAHLNLVACSSNSSTAWPYPNGQQTSCGSTSDRRTVTQSPGKKRVLPLPPNNNPFKKGRAVDKSATCSTEGHFLFTSEVDGQLKNGSLEQDNASTGVSYRACKEQTQTCTKSLVPDIRSVAEEAVDSKDMAAQVATVREVADSQVLVQVELVKTLASMQAECSKVQASRHQEFAKTQALIQPQGSLKTQASTASHPASAKVGNGSSIAPQVTKQQREAKAKATKSSMQSKVVASAMVCSTPSLLKFFQRAPTL